MPLSFAIDSIRIPDHVVTRAVTGATVLLNADTGRYFTLDESGARAWAALAASPSIGAAYETLLAAYDVDPDVLRHDLEVLIGALVAEGLAEVHRA
jgi:hypothetical protein